MIIVQSPLRVSLFGGGTDFPSYYLKRGGCAFTTAINKYVYVIVKPRFDDKIRLTYTKTELVDSVKDLKHKIVRECLKHVGITGGIEVVTIGDVPAGTGLGSSGAVTVGVLKALYAYIGQETNAEQLAQEACHIEREVLHKPIGVQDQYISAYGGFRFFQFGEKIRSKKLNVGKLPEHILLFYTGISRNADKVLKTQLKNTKKNWETLDAIGEVAYDALWEIEKGNPEALGVLLNQTWNLKKKLAETISNDKINKLYNKAIKAGATGGKILGAGAGGFLLVYCSYETKDKVRKAFSNLTEMPFVPEPDGAKVILNYRT
jgi:D-glycero-alpha-D-manno-heptose-7-phosphate kinase